MCGLCGIIRYDTPAPALAPRLRLMQHRLRHRGPDGEGKYFGSHAALAHTRLAMLDLEGGAQPLSSPDGRYTIVYNGEVYNAEDLRPGLVDRWDFRSRSDAEVVLAAFVAWGMDSLPRLNGMFAFFIWDEKEGRGFAARDRLGVKPFVYRATPDEFAFASEAKALLTNRARLHLPSLLEYVVVPSLSGVEHPLFDGLEYLPAGHWLEVSRAGVRIERWWDYEMRDLRDDADALAGEMRVRLVNAVRRSLRSDAELGVYLSGGIDSTLIAAIAGLRRSYTICYDGQERYSYGNCLMITSDDTGHARRAAEALGLIDRHVHVGRDSLLEALPHLSEINDAIPAWEQEFAQYFLAREAAQKVKGVLVGDAADETHYGYHFLLDGGIGDLIRRFGGDRRIRLLRPELREGLLENLESRYRAIAESAGYPPDAPDGCTLALTCVIVRRWLGRLLHNGDIHSMAWGIEARVPFADAELLDLARRVAPGVAFRGGVEKALLREAASGLMPHEARVRRKSALPKDQGAGSRFQAALLERLREHPEFLGRYFDLGEVATLCAAPCDDVGQSMLFNLLACSHWAERFGVE